MSEIVEEMDRIIPIGRQADADTLELKFEHGKIRVQTPRHERIASSKSDRILGDNEFLNGTPKQHALRLLMDALRSE